MLLESRTVCRGQLVADVGVDEILLPRHQLGEKLVILKPPAFEVALLVVGQSAQVIAPQLT
jgi:hypothetical protein